MTDVERRAAEVQVIEAYRVPASIVGVAPKPWDVDDWKRWARDPAPLKKPVQGRLL